MVYKPLIILLATTMPVFADGGDGQRPFISSWRIETSVEPKVVHRSDFWEAVTIALRDRLPGQHIKVYRERDNQMVMEFKAGRIRIYHNGLVVFAGSEEAR